jgi:hypothetical protein
MRTIAALCTFAVAGHEWHLIEMPAHEAGARTVELARGP